MARVSQVRRFKGRKSPGLRFSVRALLLAITALGITLGIQMNRTQTQRAAVQAIHDFGGYAVYDYEYVPGGLASEAASKGEGKPSVPPWLLELLGVDFFHPVWSVNLAWKFNESGSHVFNEQVTDEALVQVQHLPDLRQLVLLGRQATDDAMIRVAKLQKLEELYIYSNRGKASYPAITDAGISHLGKLKNLQIVHIHDAAIGDESLKTFGNLNQLEELWLSCWGSAFSDDGLRQLGTLTRLRVLAFSEGLSVEFTDEGLAHLQGLRMLESLRLRGRHISDHGLQRLAMLPNLKRVWITSDSVTPEGAKQFQEALPNASLIILTND